MSAPGVGVAMFGCGKQVAVSRPGIDAGQHGLGTLEDFVVQAHTNRRQVLAPVDFASLSRGRLMHIVNGALADRHAQQIAHQFHDATIGAVADEENCYDNAPMESFWGSLKNEMIHHQRYATRANAEASIKEYIEIFYNRQRRHSRLGYVSPASFAENFRKQALAA